jgi:exodeoxyribonuclease VII small subunit
MAVVKREIHMNEITLESLTFELALAELEKIVRELEDGTIGLEKSLAYYEKGVTLLKRCYLQLQQAEQKIELLKGLGEDGKPATESFEPALNNADSAENKRRRKKTNDGDILF